MSCGVLATSLAVRRSARARNSVSGGTRMKTVLVPWRTSWNKLVTCGGKMIALGR